MLQGVAMWNRFRLVLAVIPLCGLLVVAERQQPPASSQPPTAPPPGAQAPQGRGTLSSTSNEGADFSPKPPIRALPPEEQAKRFVLPPGYRMELEPLGLFFGRQRPDRRLRREVRAFVAGRG